MYKILNISGCPSLAVIAYLYKKREWIDSRFIQRLDNKYKVNNISILLDNGFLKEELSTFCGQFGKKPKCYVPTSKLLSLTEGQLSNRKLEETIDSSIHLLNGWHFNHWKYNYSNIEFKVPVDEITMPSLFKKRFSEESYIEYLNNNIIPYWGGHKKDYFIPICKDDNFSGRHHNFYTYHKKELRKYLFDNPVELDVAYCQPLLLGDSLYNAFGNNDFSNLLMNTHYDVYTVIGESRDQGKELFNDVIFGTSYPNRFSQGFPEAHNILKQIKQGHQEYFYRWVGDKVYTTDSRLTIKEDDKQYRKAKSKGELHYKVISLMLQLKEVEIMRKVWTELKKEKIVFVPIHDSVVVDGADANNAEKIMREVWSSELSNRFRVEIKRKNN